MGESARRIRHERRFARKGRPWFTACLTTHGLCSHLETLIVHHLLGWSVLIQRETATLIEQPVWSARCSVVVARTLRGSLGPNRMDFGRCVLLFPSVDLPRTQRPDFDRHVDLDPSARAPCSVVGRNGGRPAEEAIVWARGTVAFAGGPYLLISYVPYLSVLAIWFVASQSAWFLGFATGQDIDGTTWVNDPSGKSLMGSVGRQPMVCYGLHVNTFQSELLLADGTMIGINFVLACTAIQSMVLFIGAISVLNMSWKKRARALLLVIPTIHALNGIQECRPHLDAHDLHPLGLVGTECVRIRPQLCCSVREPLRHVPTGVNHVEMLPNMHRNIMALTGSNRRGQRL